MTLYAGMAFLAMAIALVVYNLASTPSEAPPKLGLRGLKRQQALAAGAGFALVEPIVRKMAGWVAHLPIRDLRRRAAVMLSMSGDFLGLTANEFIALIALGGVGGLLIGTVISIGLGTTMMLALAMGGFGAFMPYSMVSSEGQRRRNSIERELPATIELIALCMSAGLDFTGAVKQATADHGLAASPLREEMRRILRELELGHSRRRALEALAQRVPSDSVRDFVAAVVQSEERGNPLRDVLRIQASVLRTRRSILAEESAAKASVAMIGPLVMLLTATLLLLAGPLFMRAVMSPGGL